jgi:hypothetical protein
MSQTTHNNDDDEQTNKPDLGFTVVDVELEEIEIPPMKRENSIQGGPRILTRDFDLYILKYDKDNYVIKSCITDQPVANRRYNKETGYIEKIDPNLEEEDRRLLITGFDPLAVLAEDYYKSLNF